jgi:hypothetical protein
MTHEEKQAALEAGRILNSEVFNRVWDELDAKAVEVWRGSKSLEQREESFAVVRVLAQVKDKFFSMLQCAAFAEGGKDEALNASLATAKVKRNRKTEGKTK